MDYYESIKEKLLQSEIYDRAKDYSKDTNKVIVYFEIGKLLSQAGKEYGKNIIKQYSEKLIMEVGKKYNERNLRYMRRFYEVFKDSIWNPLGSKLTWTNIRITLSLKSIGAIKYYIDISKKYNLSKRQLEARIKSKEYERLPDNTKNKIVKSQELDIKDLIPNPIIIKNNLLNEKLSEYALQQLILNNLDEFLLQLGNGFSYVGNEYKIKIGNTYNYIDLLLFNYEYNCFVVVELKVTELKKEHIGQIEVYMNYIDNNLRKINQDKTIGIIITKKDNKYIIEYSSDERILSRVYELV